MACDNLSLGRLEPCKDSVGGIKYVYFINNGELSVTNDVTNTDAIATLGTGLTAYRYEIRSTASTFTQNTNSSRDNGTTFWEQVLELTLKGITPADLKEIKLLSYSRPHVLVEDNNGSIFVAGLEYGMDVTGGTIVTGGAMGDLSGFTISLTGMEKIPANYLAAASLSAAGVTTVQTGA